MLWAVSGRNVMKQGPREQGSEGAREQENKKTRKQENEARQLANEPFGLFALSLPCSIAPCFYGICFIGSSITGVRLPSFSA
jgi:hypothetical protein